MKYADLSDGLREKLEAYKIAMVRYSSNVADPDNKVDDAMLLNKDSQIDPDKLHGYVAVGSLAPWYDFVAEGKEEKEALGIAYNALMDVEPDYAETGLKELEA